MPATHIDTEIAVVGAGVIGAASARALARRGHQVALIEQYRPANLWGASHGRARIFRLGYEDTTYVRLAQAALPRWQDLEQATGAAVLTVTGAVDHGDPARLAAVTAALVSTGEAVESLTAEQGQTRWPGRVFDGPVLHHARAGRLDAEAAVHAFLADAVTARAQVLTDTSVERIDLAGEDDVRLHTASGTVRARRVVVAAGAWTEPLLGDLLDSAFGVGLPALRVTQEQPAVFAPVPAPWPSFIHHLPVGATEAPSGTGVYGMGGPEGVKIGHHGIGRVVDPARRREDAPVHDEAEVAALQAYARRWLPGVDADRVSAQTGTYTTTLDGDFVVDRVGPITVAAGFSGHGFKFAPVIGEFAADLALGTWTSLPADLFALAAERFSLRRTRVTG